MSGICINTIHFLTWSRCLGMPASVCDGVPTRHGCNIFSLTSPSPLALLFYCSMLTLTSLTEKGRRSWSCVWTIVGYRIASTICSFQLWQGVISINLSETRPLLFYLFFCPFIFYKRIRVDLG